MYDSLRMQSVQTPIIPVVGELIRANPGTISLGQGVAWYGPPPEAGEHIQRFFADPQNHKYKLVQGIPELLEAIERKLAAENGIRLGGDQRIVVTAGANMGFVNAVLAITDPGDEVILNLPYYFNHEMAITMADCKTVCVPTDEDYQLQPALIERAITGRTRAVVTISPNNPTGAVYSEESLRQVNEICRKHGLYHISDEAYEYFTYDGARHFSPGAIEGSSQHTISLFSLSKAYGFASWRIGWMVIPERLFMPVRKIQDTVLICPPVISQWAAVGAMRRKGLLPNEAARHARGSPARAPGLAGGPRPRHHPPRRWRILSAAAHPQRHGPHEAHAAADRGAQGRRHPRNDVRRLRPVPVARRLRRTWRSRRPPKASAGWHGA